MADFKLVRPCPKCPFRTDVPGYLTRDRAAEIARALAEGGEFHCHETVDYDTEDEPTGGDQFCAGALIALERGGVGNNMTRIAERLGAFDVSRLDMDSPVVGSLAEFVHRHGGDGEPEPETCEVAEMGCLAPAGYMVGGHAVPAEAEGETHECPGCARPVCDVCSNDEGVCSYCAEEAA